MSPSVLDSLLGRRRPVLIDGAVGTELARRGVDTTLPLWSARALFDDPRLRGEWVAVLGVELIVIEPMSCRGEAEEAVLGGRDTGLPVLLSLCPREPRRLFSGEPLEEAVPGLVDLGGEALRAILLNCATPEVLQRIFPQFVALAPLLPHGLYAHLGEPDEVSGWGLPGRRSPEKQS